VTVTDGRMIWDSNACPSRLFHLEDSPLWLLVAMCRQSSAGDVYLLGVAWSWQQIALYIDGHNHRMRKQRESYFQGVMQNGSRDLSGRVFQYSYVNCKR